MKHKREKPVIEINIQQYLMEESEKSRLAGEIAHELEGPRFQEYFSKFDEKSVRQFIQSYSMRKAQYLQYSPQFLREQEQNVNDDLENAMELLWEIQQKKLFNLQCLWRADKIHIPGIEVTYDFIYWEKNISECPFIEAVTNEEVNLYIEYVNSDFYSEPHPLSSWQDFEGFRKEPYEDDFVALPSWYTFYDNHMGTEELLNMPDIRGEKEKQYLPSNNQKNDVEDTLQKMEDQMLCKPRLDITEPGILEDFIRKFESRKLLDLCEVYEKELHKRMEYNAIESAIEILKNSGEQISIEASADWQTAILNAAYQFEKRQAEKHIRYAFSEYILRQQSGISQLPSKWSIQEELYADKLQSYKEQILRARLESGEEPTFNF
jgi:hypothetical protein